MMRFVKHAVAAICLTGCVSDPFDPLIGPRNPKPAAATYLAAHGEISRTDIDRLLEQESCPVTVLRRLVDSPSREVRALVAGNPSADGAVLEKLSSDPDPAVRQYVAGNDHISRRILKKLAADPDPLVRSGLADNPNWTAAEIRRMYQQKTAPDYKIAANPSAPPDVLKELTYGSDPGVLASLARNPSIPPYIIHRLANDPSPSVRLMLADNDALPPDVLEKLAKDPDERVRSSALDQIARQRKKP